MERATTARPALGLFTVCILALLCSSLSAAGQKKAEPTKPVTASEPQQENQDEETRRLWDEGLLQARRASRNKRARRNYSYRRVTPALVAPTPATTKDATPKPGPAEPNSKINAKDTASTGDRVVGVTFWRLRRPAAGDEARILVQEEESQPATEWTPERIAAETPLKEGQFVRLSIEAPHSGYLYVIDREKYDDNSLGDPYLIFPTLRTRGGDNRVEAGRLVEIPAQEDNPPYFTMRPSNPKQVAEMLTIIITDEPLDVPALRRDAIKLHAKKVNEWEQTWRAPVERIEQVGGQGAAWTAAEKEAGQDEERLLTQDEPLPQTIYHVVAKPGQPILINVPLLYGGK